MKKVLSGILALMIAGSFSIPAFAAEKDITAVEVTVNSDTEDLKDTLKDDASQEEGMLRISSDTLLKIKLQLSGDDASDKDMSFITNKQLGAEEEISNGNIQFIDEQTTDEEGTVTIKFRPRASQSIGIYNMRANADGATMFSKFYKTVKDEKQPVLSEARETPSGDDIEVTISDYTDEWKNANELYVIVDENNKTKIENYTIEGDSEPKTLKIPATGALANPGKYTLKFIPTEDGIAYNPITFKATVTEKKYYVEFDVKDASVEPFTESALTEKEITLPTNATKDGYDFKGWYKGETEVKTITSDNLASLYGDGKTLSLTAKFEPTTYTITYNNLEDGTNADGNPATYTIESENITLLAPTRKGYTFEGWYSDENKTTKVTEITKGTTGDKTLYAKWDAKMLEVTKSVVSSTGNDVVGETDNVITGVSSTVQEGAEVTLTVTPPVGYDVKSVKCNDTECEKTEGGYKFTASGEAVGITVTLEPITYTIEFNLDGGSGEFNAVTGTIEAPPTLPTATPTKTGHHFGGWYTSAEGGTQITQDNFAAIIPSSDDTNKITAVALYIENSKYTVIYQAPGVEDETTIPSKQENVDWVETPVINISETEPKKAGYTFAGWKVKVNDSEDFASETIYKKDGENKTYEVAEGVEKVTFVAQWTANTYKISYELNGGTNNGSNPTEYTADTATIPLAEPTKAGYRFAGWYTEAGFTNVTDSIAAGSTGDKTLYAKWTAVAYTITLKNGETSSEISGTVENPPTLTTPEKDGYEFKGWFTAETGGEEVEAITAENIAGLDGKTLYARWEEIQTDIYKIVSIDKTGSSVKVIKRKKDSAYLIVATYTDDGEMLVNASIKDISTVQTDASGQDVSMPNAFMDEYTNVRVFMWDTLESMLPRCTVFNNQ